MPPLADLLQKSAPHLRAQLVDLVPTDYVASLERRNADIALIPDLPLPEWVNREPLFYSPFHVIAREGHPITAGLGKEWKCQWMSSARFITSCFLLKAIWQRWVTLPFTGSGKVDKSR